MLPGSELAFDQATIERSRNRAQAIMAKANLAGYKFIRLRLKNIRRRKIVGIDAIVANDFVNEELGGITDYAIEVKGGEINFEYRPELGMYVFDMLDTDRNREFLASHLAGDFWEIMDRRIESDVTRRAELIAKRIRDGIPISDAPSKFWQEVRASEEQTLRAARGEIEIPKATMTVENPVSPGEEIKVEYEEPIAARRGSRSVKPGPQLKALHFGDDIAPNVSQETSPLGVGVVSP